MAKNQTIDIKRPGGSWKREALFYIGLIMVVGVITGCYIYTKKAEPEEKKRTQLFVSQNIDPDFFATEDPPEPRKSEIRTPRRAPKVERQIVNIQKKQIKAPPVEKNAPTPSDLFKFKAPKKESNFYKQINTKRRGSVKINVKSNNTDSNTDNQKKELKGEWKEPKTVASLPIDMTRVLTEDRMISAILIPEIDSELGGKVTAQIENNVYGAHGRKILIPAGTKAIGRYKPVEKIGQERIPVFWSRLITPSGINIHVENAEMTDSMARAGITGHVDKRYSERYGISLLVSLFTATTSYSIPVKNENQQVAIESFGKEQSSLAKAILEEHMEIKPKVTIPVGSRILISPSKDIWFKKLKKNEIVILSTEEKIG